MFQIEQLLKSPELAENHTITKLLDEVAYLRRIIADQEYKIQLKQNLEQKPQQMCEGCARLAIEIERLKTQLSQSNENIQALELEGGKQRSQVVQLESELKNLTSENSSLRHQLESVRQLKQTIADLTNQLTAERTKNQDYESRLASQHARENSTALLSRDNTPGGTRVQGGTSQKEHPRPHQADMGIQEEYHAQQHLIDERSLILAGEVPWQGNMGIRRYSALIMLVVATIMAVRTIMIW